MKERMFTILAVVVCASVPVAADVINWNNVQDGDWSTDSNWLPVQVPAASDDAQHLTKLSRIAVTGDQQCLSFQGNGANPSDRFLLIEAGKTLEIAQDGGGGLSGTSGAFFVRLEDGTAQDLTTLLDGDDVSNIVFSPASSQNADYARIDVSGAVSGASMNLGDHTDIDIGGPLTGSSLTLGSAGYLNIDGTNGYVTTTGLEVGDGCSNCQILITGDDNGVAVAGSGGSSPETWTIGDNWTVHINKAVTGIAAVIGTTGASSNEPTTVKIGQVGSLGPNEHWTLQGYADVIVSNESGYGNGSFETNLDDQPTITQRNHSKLTVQGLTKRGEWLLYDNSLFTGGGVVADGVWELNGASKVVAESDVFKGAWTVKSDAGGGAAFAVNVPNGAFNPETLTVFGGTVDCKYLGFDISQPPNHPSWTMALRSNAYVAVDTEGWHNPSSPIEYDGTHNEYKALPGAKGISIGGPIRRIGDPQK